MGTFFIADPHFGHQEIIKFANRPFQSSREMDELILKNWNETVQPSDLIYVLGDFALQPTQEAIAEWVQKLNGYKILIQGNHDRKIPLAWWTRESGFDEVSRFPILAEGNFILSHEPIFSNDTMPYVNIYGHVHNCDLYKDVSPHGFCVSVERIGYKPIELAEIKKRLAAQ